MSYEGTAQEYWRRATEQALMGVLEQAERMRELALSTDHAGTLKPWQRQLLDATIDFRYGRDQMGGERLRYVLADADGAGYVDAMMGHLQRSRLSAESQRVFRSAVGRAHAARTGGGRRSLRLRRWMIAPAVVAIVLIAAGGAFLRGWFGHHPGTPGPLLNEAIFDSQVGILVNKTIIELRIDDAPPRRVETLEGLTPGTAGLSHGTAFVVSKDGYLLTNRHVIESHEPEYTSQTAVVEGRRLTLTVVQPEYWFRTDAGNKWLRAKLVYKAVDRDIAVMKIEDDNVVFDHPLEIAPTPNRGQKVIAYGYPGVSQEIADRMNREQAVEAKEKFYRQYQAKLLLDLDQLFPKSTTVLNRTEGSVSSLKDTTSDHTGGELIQITTFVHNGSSGGPLIDEQGHVVGIVTIKGLSVQEGTVKEFQNINGAFSLSEMLPMLRRKVPELRERLSIIEGPVEKR